MLKYKNREEFLALVKTLKNTEVVYDKKNIVIVMVKTFSDCNTLFCSDTVNWCIANKKEYWDDYVNKPSRKQYFIIDFNDFKQIFSFTSIDDERNNFSMIGFTTEGNEIVAAHARNDDNLINHYNNRFENILKEKGIYNFVSNACNEFNFIMDVVITLVVVLMFVTPFIVLLFF
jgi:hypothetical protein